MYIMLVEMNDLAYSLYGTDNPKRQHKIPPEAKTLKQNIDDARKPGNSVEFIGIIPLLKNDPKY